MNEEIESLFALLGIKPDEASVADSVDKLVKAVQSKLKSSIYGGKNGVITLPATIEGKFKNGKEINQDIKDAYAAIYEQAKKMADESVSLTLDDITKFKAQIDKFGRKTAKYKGNDVIANANNNLRQTLSAYQDYVNELRKQVSVQQKAQTKQAQKTKAQAKAKKASYHGITDEEIDDAIAKENARQAKIKAWRDKQAEQIAAKLGYKTNSGIDAGKTNSYSMNAAEFSEYESQWARELAKTIKELYKTTIDKQWIDKEYKPKTGAKSRATSREEHLNFLSNAAFGDLADLIAKAEKGDKNVTFDKIVEAIGVMRTIYEENGKDMETIAKAVINATQSRYDDDSKHKNGGTNREEGTEKGVGRGHEQVKVYQSSISQLLKKMLGEVTDIEEKENEATKASIKMTSAYEQAKIDAKNSQASLDTKQLAQEVKGEKNRDEREYAQAVRESSAERMADSAEAQKNQEIINDLSTDMGTGFNDSGNTEPVAKDIADIKKEVTKKKDEKIEQKKDNKIDLEYLKSAITNPLAEGKCPCKEILKSIQKTLNAINGHTNAISKKIEDKKKQQTTKKKTPTKKKEEIKQSSKQETQATSLSTALDIHRDKFGNQDQFVKDIPFNSFSPKGLFKKELDAVRIGKQLADATERAIEKNKSKQVDNPKVMTTGENFNKLAPMIIDTVTNNVAGTAKEAIGKGKKEETQSQADIPAWKKAEQAVVEETQRIKEEEEARKRLADQIALETKMAQQRNAKKLRPITPATIQLEGEAGEEIGNSMRDTLKKILSKISGESEASRIMNMSERERAKETAERMRKYGKPRGRGEAGDRGVVSDVRYSKNLWRGKDAASGPDDPLYRDIRKTNPVDGVDVDKVMQALQKAIENNMFNAQTGGGWKATIAASLTGGLAYAFQPSMEKTRAQVDGLNQVMADVRQQVLNILEDIKGKQAVLGEMQENGDIAFDDQGRQVSGTPEATALFNELENSKDILDSLLAEMGNVDQVIKECGGDVGKIIQKLGFVMPELRKENTIIKNIGAGLDKNGKALKFQTRMGEVLNYSFQLMARHVGQMVKNMLMMLNPINLLKRAFQDFASYDVKWQRTMNVIKYNLRRIIRPAMEWIAQQIVNIIGLVNALMKGIGKAFGKDWDLFDQSAASAEQMREELEQAANVTASFDELHDIGTQSSSNPAEDLMGDIYTPQWTDIYQKIEDFGKKIGDVLAGIKKFTEGWNFWDWLLLIGGALIGLKILKWLIGLFGGGKNPLQSVADGLNYLLKMVSWALLIWALTEFVKALTDFVNCMKSASWEDIVKSLLMLAGAFAALVLAGGGLMLIASALGMLAPQMLGLAVAIAAFAPVIWALAAFVEAMKGLTTGDMLNGLLFLAGAFMAIAIAIGVLLAVLSAAIASGVGALAILALAGVLAVVALVIASLTELVKALGEAGEGIKKICKGIEGVIRTIGKVIMGVITTVAEGIATVVKAIAEGITNILTPILEFIDSVIGKITALATTIVHEIGETIRSVIQTTGEVIVGIIDSLVSAIPRLLDAILRFIREIGPAVESSCDAIMRTITKLINFVVSGIEYLVNTLVIDAINGAISTITLGIFNNVFHHIEIAKFVPKYEQGTNYVPNDGLAYLHQGEAVIPKKYNTPYQSDNSGMSNAINRLVQQVEVLSSKVDQGIPVKGQFVQRGSDLVATVERANNRMKNNVLSNKVYAR